MATIQFRNNSIGALVTPDGSSVTNHLDKAGLLRSVFKERLGSSIEIEDNFDFS